MTPAASAHHTTTAPPWAPIFEPAVEVDDVRVEVTGTVPEDLRGRFLQNSAGDCSRAVHFFDADALVSATTFTDGEVRFRSRYIATDKRRREQARGPGHRVRTFGTQASVPLGNVMRRPTSNALGDVAALPDGTIWNFHESGKPWVLDGSSLATIGEAQGVGPRRDRQVGHVRLDPATRETFLLATFFGADRNQLAIRVRDADGRARTLGRLRLPAAYLPHDFTLTQRWVVCVLTPWICRTPYQAFFGRKSYAASSRWSPDHPTLVFLVPRDGRGPVERVEAEPFFAFHHAAAHEVGDDVVVHLSCYDDFDQLDDQFLDFTNARFAGNRPTPWSLRIDRAARTATRVPLSDAPIEDPAVDPRHPVGAPVDHVYGCSHPDPSVDGLFTAVARVEVATGATDTWAAGPGRLCGAPQVAPTAAEPGRGGWLLTGVFDPGRVGTDVAILRADAVGDGPVAVVHLPASVGYVFHSAWVPSAGDVR